MVSPWTTSGNAILVIQGGEFECFSLLLVTKVLVFLFLQNLIKGKTHLEMRSKEMRSKVDTSRNRSNATCIQS